MPYPSTGLRIVLRMYFLPIASLFGAVGSGMVPVLCTATRLTLSRRLTCMRRFEFLATNNR